MTTGTGADLDALRSDFRARSEAAYRDASLKEMIACRASVVGGWGLPVLKSGAAIPLETNFGWAPGFVDRLSEAVPGYLENDATSWIENGDVALLSFPGAFTYGHWIIDIAARCETLARHRDLSLLKFIVPKPFFAWARPILDAYAIGDDQLIEVGNDDKIHCEHLLVPALMRVNDYLPPDPHKASLDRLRRLAAARFPRADAPAKLFVKHVPQTSFGTRATLGNAAEIQEALEAVGFTTVTPADLTVDQQIESFSHCSVILGEDSSALHNCVWNGLSSHMIVLSSPQRHNILHEGMTDLLGQTCEFLYGTLLNDRDFVVDAQQVLRSVALLG